MEEPTTPKAAEQAALVFFETLGCAKNEVDTRDMQSALLEAGYGIAEDIDSCDVVVVNTCAFIQPAIEESIDAVFEAAGCEHVTVANVPVIVAGCLPARFGSDLEDAFDEVSAFVPCSKEEDIAEIVGHVLAEKGHDASSGAGSRNLSDAQEFEGVHAGSFAYVKISDGCDRFCSYCTIPYIRGRYHSFSLDSIEAEVRDAVEAGAREIVLIGQDTGLWGKDLDSPSSLANLLAHLAEAFPEAWFRAMYTQPENVTDELLSTIASHENIAPYLDIPLQHVQSSVLSRMNRNGSPEEYAELLERIRKSVPGVAIRTTLIAGFPGETEEDFEELVSFVEESCLDYVGVFPYSREEGTAAASLDGQIDEDEKAYRAERLRTVADAVSSSVVSSREGQAYPVLVEGSDEDGQLFGRAIIQAPEVDGLTFVDSGRPGEFVNLIVEDTFLYDMEGSRRA